MLSGNYVVDYKVRYVGCVVCNGYGYFFVSSMKTPRDIVKVFCDYDFVKTFGEIKSLWRRIEKEGQVQCPNCGGKGTVEEWI